jgi:predicted chitinase
MRAHEFLVENSALDEGIKDWLLAAGIGITSLASVNAIVDYLAKHEPQVQQQVASGKITDAQASSQLLATALNPMEKLLINAAARAGIEGVELKQFLAQARHESWDFKHMEEQGTSQYFARKYDKKFSPKKAKILGNIKIGDGERYKGRGFFQLTGRYNYEQAAKALGIDLVNKPQLAADPKVAADIAVWYWKTRVKSKVSDFGNVAQSTRPINPALKGLKDRTNKFNQYVQRVQAPGPNL